MAGQPAIRASAPRAGTARGRRMSSIRSWARSRSPIRTGPGTRPGPARWPRTAACPGWPGRGGHVPGGGRGLGRPCEHATRASSASPTSRCRRAPDEGVVDVRLQHLHRGPARRAPGGRAPGRCGRRSSPAGIRPCSVPSARASSPSSAAARKRPWRASTQASAPRIPTRSPGSSGPWRRATRPSGGPRRGRPAAWAPGEADRQVAPQLAGGEAGFHGGETDLVPAGPGGVAERDGCSGSPLTANNDR